MMRLGPITGCALLYTAACSNEPIGDDVDDTTGTSSPTSVSATLDDGTHGTTGDSAPAESTSADDGDDSTGAMDSSTGDPVVPPTCGALEGIPSEPGPHIAQIEALADDEWLHLGPPAADPQFGVARGRSWGGRALVLASDLRGAFFTGEGVHAYVKPDGYGMDDVWFYDIHAHAWIAIHPGLDTNTFDQSVIDGDLSIDENGQLQDAEGHPVPMHVLIHAWDYLTFDPVSQRFAFLAGDGMGRYFMPGLETIEAGLSMLEAQRAGIAVPPMSPWFYSIADCSFERYPIATPTPDIGGFAAFQYATATDQYFYTGSQGVAVFDRTSNAWAVVADSGPRPTGYDHGACYDSLRNRIYMGSGDLATSSGLFSYDIATSTWTNPMSGGGPVNFPTNAASVFYDSVADVVTVFHYYERKHYTWDPELDIWTSRDLPAEVVDAVSYPSHNAFYDPVTNAYFVHVATDSTDNGTMWVYRWANGA